MRPQEISAHSGRATRKKSFGQSVRVGEPRVRGATSWNTARPFPANDARSVPVARVSELEGGTLMLQRNTMVGFVSLSLAVMACSDTQRPTAPAASPGDAAAFAKVAGGSERLVNVMDACDPTTFNAVLGPGGCTRNGGITFTDFIAQLTANQSVG